MTIKPYLHYEEAEILHLYQSVGWTNYTKNPAMLEKAFAGSLCALAAFEDERLVGIIRAVGDGASILFVQDLLVLPQYQRRGIGSGLMKALLERYGDVYQIQLTTDNTEKTLAFYRAAGFVPLAEIGCCGMMRVRA